MSSEPTQPSESTELPRVNLAAIRKRHKKLLADSDVLGHVGVILRGPTFESFVKAVHDGLPPGTPFANVRLSCLHLAGEALRPEALKMLTLRLAANADRLKTGPVHAWNGQPSCEWVATEVVLVTKGYNQYGAAGASIELRVLSGTPVGMAVYTWWSQRYGFVLARELGFSATWGLTRIRIYTSYMVCSCTCVSHRRNAKGIPSSTRCEQQLRSASAIGC
jgi:hypothetical protein